MGSSRTVVHYLITIFKRSRLFILFCVCVEVSEAGTSHAFSSLSFHVSSNKQNHWKSQYSRVEVKKLISSKHLCRLFFLVGIRIISSSKKFNCIDTFKCFFSVDQNEAIVSCS